MEGNLLGGGAVVILRQPHFLAQNRDFFGRFDAQLHACGSDFEDFDLDIVGRAAAGW